VSPVDDLIRIVAACASQSDLNVLYGRGIKAARKDNWESAPWDRMLGAQPVVALWDEDHF
jgi:hypothetical protein